MQRTIQKIKLDSKTYTPIITYEKWTNEGVVENITHPGDSSAHPDFIQALNKLEPIVHDVCRLSGEDWASATAQVIGVSLKDKEDGTGLNVTLLGKFEDVAVNINTPFIAPGMIDSSTNQAIELIVRECEKYIDGKRAQGSLFDQQAA